MLLLAADFSTGVGKIFILGGKENDLRPNTKLFLSVKVKLKL